MLTPAYQARFVWQPAIVRPPGKAVRVEQLAVTEFNEPAGACPREETSNHNLVPSILAAFGGEAPEVIRPPGRMIRVGDEHSHNAADNDPVLSVANCPGHTGCMCCLLLQIEKRLSQSAVVLEELYATLLPMGAQRLQLADMSSDEEDLEGLESADSVYGSSEELEDTDNSMHSEVSTED